MEKNLVGFRPNVWFGSDVIYLNTITEFLQKCTCWKNKDIFKTKILFTLVYATNEQ